MRDDEEGPRPRNHLRAWREHRGMTQAHLAAQVGTEGSVISLLESGDRSLSDKWLRRLAPVLQTTSGLLLDYDPQDVDTAMMEIFVQIPEAQRPGIVASMNKHLPATKRQDEAPEPSQEKVVNFPKPRREGDGAVLPDRNELQ